MLRRLPIAALAGVAAAAAFEPLAWFWLLPAALVVLVLCVRGQRVPAAFLIGLTWGVGMFFVLQWWIRVVGYDAWLALSATEAAFLGLFGAAAALLTRAPAWPMTVAFTWVGVEVWRSQWPFSGMPWGRLAFATIDTPYAAALPYVGANGVALLIALTATTVAWLLTDGRGRWRVGAPALLALAAATVLPVLVPWQPAETERIRVAAVQGNVPGDGSDILLDYRQVTRNHRDATVALAERVSAGETPAPRFVLWPENSTAIDPFQDTQTRDDIETAVQAIGVPILVGAIVDATEEGKLLNQGVVWDPGTGGGDRYTKRHPVPFGEYIPWRGNPFTDRFQRLDLVPRDMLGGTRRTPLVVAGVPVADAICFDVAYDDGLYDQVRRGAQLVTVQTSNAMYIHTDQIDQQFAITRTRALELGRTIAVVSPNGRSGFLGSDGRILQEAPTRQQVVLEGDLPLYDAIAPALFVGQWVGRGSAAAALLAVAVALIAYRSPGRGRHDPGGSAGARTASPTASTEVTA